MANVITEDLRISVDGDRTVSAVVDVPRGIRSAYVFAHGAGAGMTHPFMMTLAAFLAEHGVGVMRFNFPYMEAGRRAPDRQPLLLSAVRAAVERASEVFEGVGLYAGGKSMGGRMTSLAESEEPFARLDGLVFLGFPLHAAGRPDSARAAHLSAVRRPMLFVQGTRDRLADSDLMRSLIHDTLSDRATLHEIPDGDHSLRVPKRAGIPAEQILRDAAARIAGWMEGLNKEGVR